MSSGVKEDTNLLTGSEDMKLHMDLEDMKLEETDMILEVRSFKNRLELSF